MYSATLYAPNIYLNNKYPNSYANIFNINTHNTINNNIEFSLL